MIKRKQRNAISLIIDRIQFIEDNTKIDFDDSKNWCSGIMRIETVSFFCMSNLSDTGLMLKLPTLFHKKTLFIAGQNIKRIHVIEDQKCAIVTLAQGHLSVTIPWKSSFGKFRVGT